MLILDSSKVQRLMIERGLGTTRLAELADLRPKTIVEAHKRDIKVQNATLYRLARALGVSPFELVKDVA